MTFTTDSPPAMPYSVEIPPQLRSDEFRFITIPAGVKGGGNEPGWQTRANYAWHDPRIVAHLAAGGNYGVFPAAGSGITILDADDYAGCQAAGLLDSVEFKTFTVETGGSVTDKRKFHFFFRLTPPLAGKFPIHHEGVHIGEIYCQHPDGAKGYVVGAGSVHPSGERYRVAANIPIADVDRTEYAMKMSRLATREKEARREATREMIRAPVPTGENLADRLGLRCSDFLMPNKEKHRGQEVEGEHPVHGSSTGTNLTLSPDNSWWCRACESGGGPLEALAVAEGIISCNEAGPRCLWPDHWAEVIEALVARNYDIPDAEEQINRAARAMVRREAKAAKPEEPARPLPVAAPTPVKMEPAPEPKAAAVVQESAPEPATAKPGKKQKELPPFTYRHPKYGISVDVPKAADHLYEQFHVVAFNGTLYVYGDGIYRENKGQIETEIRRIVNEGGTNEQLTRITREVLAHLKAIAPYATYPFDQAPGRIPVANGVIAIDYESGAVTLDGHSPGYRFTYKLPVVYDKDADGEAFHENVIGTYVDEEDVLALYQVPAQALLQAHGAKPYKRAYILHGDANGGKSTYLEILAAFFGRENIAGASLQQIGTDRFVNGTLEGKVLNMCDDLEDVPLKNVGPFKTLTGIFDHTIERKHTNPYRGRITCPHIFTCNAPPEVPERFTYDDAFWVRWVYLHFENVFEVDPQFNAKWITPENLSGFLNRVIVVMKRIRKEGLLISPDASETKQAWTIAADPFAKFVAAEMRPADKEQKFTKETLLKAFIAWCGDNNIPSRKTPTTVNALTRLTFKNEFRTVRVGKDWQYGAKKQWNSGSQYIPTKEDEAAGENRTL